MAKKAAYADEADYVVVGSGSSGAAIAGRLAESGASVIVVEAGKSDEQFLVKKPGMIGPMHSVPQIKQRVDWGFYSVPQKHLLDRKMPVPRGKVVGGSSSINGMVYVRGNRANYDAWAAEGSTGWDADTVNAAYQRMEDFEDGANDYRGAGGPIRVTRNHTPQEGSLQFIQAASDTLGAKILDDYNAEAQEGVSRMQQNAAAGLRYSASRGYIHHLKPGGLELQSETLTTRVVIENGRATGIEVDHPRRQGGHPLGRLRRLRAAADAVRHRPRPAPARPRHRRARRPAGR
jgi:choline dehydrogenase